jgi:hypothetical protein
MILILLLGFVTALVVFALSIGFWNKSMRVTTVLMGLACVAGILLAEEANSSEVLAVYAGLAFAFVVYFCYMLAELVATLKQIAMALQTTK